MTSGSTTCTGPGGPGGRLRCARRCRAGHGCRSCARSPPPRRPRRRRRTERSSLHDLVFEVRLRQVRRSRPAGCDHDHRLHRQAQAILADTLASAGHDRDLVGEQSGHPGIKAAVDHQRRSESGAAVPLASHSMMGAMSSVSSKARPRGGSWRALSAAIPAASCASVGVERDAVGGDAVGTPRLGQRLGQQTNPFTQRRQRRVLGAAGRRHQGHEHDERAAVRRQGFMRLAGQVDHRSQRAITPRPTRPGSGRSGDEACTPPPGGSPKRRDR